MQASLALSGWLWPAARFRAANLLANLALPGGLALTCTALYCIYLSLTWFILEGTLNVLLLCIVPFSFYLYKILSKKKLNCQYYTNGIFNSHNIIWIKIQLFIVNMFLDIANENKNKTTRNVCLFNTNRFIILHLKIPTLTLLRPHILAFTTLLQTSWESDCAFNL